MIDKNIINKKIKQKDYSNCIFLLFTEIKNTLVNEIKKKKNDYVYITIGDLKNKALKYLPSDLQSYAIILYTQTINPEDDELYTLNLFFEIYKDLNDKKLLVA